MAGSSSQRHISPQLSHKLSAYVHPDHILTNFERFVIDAVQRPPAKRSQSAPPQSRLALPPVPKPPAPTLTGRLRKTRRAIAKAAGKHPHRTFVALVAILSTALGVYAAINTLAHNAQTSPILDLYSARYNAPANTWLYADSPDQLLGLPAPLWPSHVQPPAVTHKLIRRSARYWGDDKHLSHNNAPKHEFWAIARRIQTAKEQFYKRPPYAEVERFGPMGERMATQPAPAMDAALTDGVPYFRPGCVCSIRAAVDAAVKHALVPYPLHAPLPQTADDLKEYCPCSMSAAVYRWVKGLNTLPPPISAFYDDAPWFVRWPNMGFAPYRDEADLTEDELREAQRLGWIAKKREDGREG